MIEREDDQNIVVLRLAHGKASALDVELLEELRRQFRAARGAGAVILTGTGSIFSAGVDLVRLLDGGADYARALLEGLDNVIDEIFLFPRPVIAAINGHAIAGGCVLASLTDYRLMSSGKIGVPELLVGVPFPPLVLEVLRATIPAASLQRLVLTGVTLSPDDAFRDGVIDEVSSADRLLVRAREIARNMAAIPPRAYELAKLQLRTPAVEQAREAIEQHQQEVVAIWCAPQTRAAIADYVSRTLRK